MEAFALLLSFLVALSLAGGASASFDTAEEGKMVIRLLIWRAIAAAFIMVGALVVIFDFNIVIQ